MFTLSCNIYRYFRGIVRKNDMFSLFLVLWNSIQSSNYSQFYEHLALWLKFVCFKFEYIQSFDPFSIFIVSIRSCAIFNQFKLSFHMQSRILLGCINQFSKFKVNFKRNLIGCLRKQKLFPYSILWTYN